MDENIKYKKTKKNEKKQHKYKYTGIYTVADHMLKNYYNTIG